MKKFFIQAIFLLIVIFAGAYFSFQGRDNFRASTPTIDSQKVVSIKGVRINVEVADSPEERRLGLGGRQSLASDSGMLFVFQEEKIHTFWMKGLSFPLDFFWLRNNRIVDITKNAKPPTAGATDQDLPIYVPREPVTKVLEVNGGFADTHGIRIGDIVEELP